MHSAKYVKSRGIIGKSALFWCHSNENSGNRGTHAHAKKRKNPLKSQITCQKVTCLSGYSPGRLSWSTLQNGLLVGAHFDTFCLCNDQWKLKERGKRGHKSSRPVLRISYFSLWQPEKDGKNTESFKIFIARGCQPSGFNNEIWPVSWHEVLISQKGFGEANTFESYRKRSRVTDRQMDHRHRNLPAELNIEDLRSASVDNCLKLTTGLKRSKVFFLESSEGF